MKDVLCRTFSVDYEFFGATQTEELVEGGSEIYVSEDNVEEYVRLDLEYRFEKQCETPLAYFKKGFERLADVNIIKEVFSHEEL